MLTDQQLAGYQRDGFVRVPAFLDAEETELLLKASRSDPTISQHTLHRDDGEGGLTRLSLWSDAGDDLFGLLVRCERMVGAAEKCVGEEAYHWHSKVIQKDAHTGGAWSWHQDYGYWYNDTVLYPRLVSCFIALNPATKENGCLQVLRGSHHVGRIDHVRLGDQSGADPARVEAASKHHELVYCEMDPGDALFFHCNILHRSDQNRSENPRWSLICCYNAASNSPFGETWQPSYSKLDKVPDSALKEAGLEALGRERTFLDQ